MAVFQQSEVWDDDILPVSGNTPFGFYDDEIEFQADAPRFAKWAARRLGYPVVEIELTELNMYASFEEAVNDYWAQVNQYLIRDNILNAQGLSTSYDLTQKNLVTSGMPQVIELAKAYGAEVGAGGNIPYYTGSIQCTDGTQDYDLNAWAAVSASGKPIEIKRIFHYQRPAISRYYDPFVETGLSRNNLLSEFGWAGYSPNVQYLLFPIYEDLLRVQAVELNDQIRRSAYSFELVNNKLRIFPIPTADFRLWFEFIYIEDRNLAGIQHSSTGSSSEEGATTATSSVQSDFSNIQYNMIPYGDINDTGVQWIRKYGLACAKETLGLIRSKYQSVPIPGAEVTLDGDTLRSEAITEKETLITQLREILEQSTQQAAWERKQQIDEAHQESLKKIPLKLYIG